MNESLVLNAAGNLSMEISRLRSITQRLDADVLAGGRVLARNDVALGVLLSGLCVGLLLLLLFFLAVCCKVFNTRDLTVFKVSLIFTGLLQSLSSPVVAMELMGSTCSLKYCHKLLAVWFASRHCGVLLHLLVALEFILIRQQFLDDSKMIPLYWSLPVVLTLDLICILFFEVIKASVALGAVAMILTLVIFIQACFSSRSLDKRSKKVLWAAFLTFGITSFPNFVIECIIINGESISVSIYDIFLCWTNLRLITDGYLYWLTCRDNPVEAPEQMEAGQGNLDSLR